MRRLIPVAIKGIRIKAIREKIILFLDSVVLFVLINLLLSFYFTSNFEKRQSNTKKAKIGDLGKIWEKVGKKLGAICNIISTKEGNAMEKSMKLKDKERAVLSLVKGYRRAQRSLEIRDIKGEIQENEVFYNDDKVLVHLVESSLKKCSEDSQRIIENEYFTEAAHDWYLSFYSKSTFYRLKHRAIEEFVNCLNL